MGRWKEISVKGKKPPTEMMGVPVPQELADAIFEDCKRRSQSLSDWLRTAMAARLDGEKS
jgi:hypothetical protein